MPDSTQQSRTEHQTDATNHGLLRRLLAKCVLPFLIGSLSLSFAGFCVRLTVRDQYYATAILYYITPPSVLAILLPICSGLLYFRKRRKSSLMILLAGLTCLVWWFQTGYFQNNSTGGNNSISVLLWNVSHGSLGWSGITEEIQRHSPQIVGLVEAGPKNKTTRRFWKETFPEYDSKLLGNGLVLLVKGKILETQTERFGLRSHLATATVLIDNQQLTVILVDIYSSPWVFRKHALEGLTDLLDQKNHVPLLVMGDFNTPTDSVHFRKIRGKFSNAFETAGNGFPATWPVPLPFLSLDQIWTNHEIEVRDCRLDWSLRSDHRPVLTNITLRAVYENP